MIKRKKETESLCLKETERQRWSRGIDKERYRDMRCAPLSSGREHSRQDDHKRETESLCLKERETKIETERYLKRDTEICVLFLYRRVESTVDKRADAHVSSCPSPLSPSLVSATAFPSPQIPCRKVFANYLLSFILDLGKACELRCEYE